MQTFIQIAAGAVENIDEISRDRINSDILNLRSGEKSRKN